MNEVKRSERGWPGHFIGAYDCIFRRNTLLECDGQFVVVSTVGRYLPKKYGKVETIGINRYFETMAFMSDENDQKFHDADVSKEVKFESNWAISTYDPESDIAANEMHEAVVKELTEKLQMGEKLEVELL